MKAKYTVQEIEGMGEEELNTVAAELMDWTLYNGIWLSPDHESYLFEWKKGYSRKTVWNPTGNQDHLAIVVARLVGRYGYAAKAGFADRIQSACLSGTKKERGVYAIWACFNQPLHMTRFALLTHLQAEGRLVDG
ncbi:hypothetical protein KS4_23560 [Poriferisphaera corsica]|uniref:Uncharacterized protein n=1 Tax=Poriferisphaera corsica TaxID=2528020 RepID=A0A517YVQ2_9BACT|nr:hypothetical protein [Poriferisphaera corsica]QDU34289.1 hypothetical protein KS4_23560 [Poriferisphaera corsica]